MKKFYMAIKKQKTRRNVKIRHMRDVNERLASNNSEDRDIRREYNILKVYSIVKQKKQKNKKLKKMEIAIRMKIFRNQRLTK